MSIVFRFLLLSYLWIALLCFSEAIFASTILVVGDSLSAAHGFPIDQGWVTLLTERLKQQQYPYQVVNISSSGDTTTQGLLKLPNALNQYQPEVVIIALGANDGLRGLPIALIQKNLSELIRHSQKAHAKVMLIGLLLPLNYGPVYRKQFEQIYQNLAMQFHLIKIPFFLNNIALNPALMQADGLHPTANAQPLIVDNVWPYLRKTLKSPK